MAFRKHHGITLAGSSWIENLNVERLVADPTPLTAGRIWFNETDKELRFSSLDGLGAVSVITIPSKAALTSLESLVSTINGDDTTEGSFRKTISDVVGLATPETMNTLQEISAALNNDPDVYNTLTNLVNVSISNLESTILGTATTAMDTLGEVQAVIGDPATLATTATTLVSAINEVLTAVGAEETRALAAEAALQAELDATQAAAGLNANGTYVTRTGTNYIDGASTLTGEIALLDAAIKAVADNGGGATGALQTEVDATQAGVGLGADGSHVARVGTNYINGTTTVVGEITALDTALKAEETARIAGVDQVEASAGLNTDGTYVSRTGSNFLDAATTLAGESTLLDAALKAEETARLAADSALQSEVDATQAGAGLATDGTHVPRTGTNYLDAATSLAGEATALDTALKAEVDRATAAEAANATAISDLATAQGGITGTLASLTTTDKSNLVAAINEVDANLDAYVASNDAVIGTVGSLTTTATNLVGAINEVSTTAATGTSDLKAAINAKKAIFTASVAATEHTFNHGFAGADLDVTVLVWDAVDSVWTNDSTLVSVNPATTTVTVPLQVAAIIKIIVEDLSDIA